MSPETSSQRVLMIVMAKITDGEKMKAYQGALVDSGLYPKNEGRYLGFGRPLVTFEGETGSNEAFVVAEFPSREHAEAFWNSDDYQERIKPLRKGAGEFHVVVIPASGD